MDVPVKQFTRSSLDFSTYLHWTELCHSCNELSSNRLLALPRNGIVLFWNNLTNGTVRVQNLTVFHLVKNVYYFMDRDSLLPYSQRPATYFFPTLMQSRYSYPICLTLTLLTWRIWWSRNNASRWQMSFNSAFNVFRFSEFLNIFHISYHLRAVLPCIMGLLLVAEVPVGPQSLLLISSWSKKQEHRSISLREVKASHSHKI